MKNKLTVYCDMDQVLVALHDKLSDILGKNISHPFNEEEKKKIRDYNTKEPIFLHSKKMPGTDELIKFIEDHFQKYAILSLDDKLVTDQAKQKKEWVKKHLNGWKFIVVENKGTNKAFYANPHSILIDDNVNNIDAWQKAGGIGIWYHNAQDAIKSLENCLNFIL